MKLTFLCPCFNEPVTVANAVQRKLMYFWPSGGEGITSFGARHCAFYWHLNCLCCIGRRAEVPAKIKGAGIEDHDLRLSPRRAETDKHLPFRMEQSYFEKQAAMGLDLSRLYD